MIKHQGRLRGPASDRMGSARTHNTARVRRATRQFRIGRERHGGGEGGSFGALDLLKETMIWCSAAPGPTSAKACDFQRVSRPFLSDEEMPWHL